MTIDSFAPEPWPPSVVTALDSWKQGHLLKGNLLAWITPGTIVDPVTGEDAVADPETWSARASDVSDTSYYAIISQTCDIAAEGPGKRHPFVQVCPVRDIGRAFAPDKVAQIKSGSVAEYFYLSRPPEAGDWAIDLRASTAISKGILASITPVEAFASEGDEIALGQHIAWKFSRPALHDVISGEIVTSVNRLISSAKSSSAWCDDIEQIRLEVVDGTRLSPKRVRLIVVTDTALSASDRAPLRAEWRRHRKLLTKAGIEPSPLAFRQLSKLPISEYRDSIPLNIPSLGRGQFI